MTDRSARFPLGAAIDLDELARDPYPSYATLREHEPISFVAALNMYLVTRYDDVSEILQDSEHFVVGTEQSTVFDTFGEHMMTVEGAAHVRYKKAHQPFFMPAKIKGILEPRILEHVDGLIDEFAEIGEVELRRAFSSRLPVLVMLSTFGLAAAEELRLRMWYDSFEKALSNFTWDGTIRAAAKENVDQFVTLMQRYIAELRSAGEAPSGSTMLGALLGAPSDQCLDDEEICRNSLIIFFGGISTVDALILNTLYALSTHPDTFERVRADDSLIPATINEAIRWLGPVQSATRHVAKETTVRGVTFRRGDTVNCMLAAANHDPTVFEHPADFDIDRKNLQKQLGFAVGPHHCLGSRLARAEARIALERLFERLPGFRLDLDRIDGPHGYEFRQPAAAVGMWRRE